MLGVRRSVAAGVSGKARIANTVSSFPVAPSLIDMHRHFAARIQQQSAANVFDRDVKRFQRVNAVLRPDANDYDYLRQEVATRLVDRITCIRTPFERIVDIGSGTGAVASRLVEAYHVELPYVRHSATREFERIAIETEQTEGLGEVGNKMEVSEAVVVKPDGVNDTTGSGKGRGQGLGDLGNTVTEYYRGLMGLKEITLVDEDSTLVRKSIEAANETMRMFADWRQGQAIGSSPTRKQNGDSLDGNDSPFEGLGSDAPLTHLQSTLGPAVPITEELPGIAIEGTVADIERLDALPPNSASLVTSSLAMHWINDLPTFLRQVLNILQPDGVFCATMLGGNTLQELRSAFAVADTERLGGVANHVSPFVGAKDVGDLLTSAGFNMVSVDVDTINVLYPDMFTLIDHLERMGEQAAPAQHLLSHVTRKDAFLAAAAAYDALYTVPEQGLIVATFDVIHMIGWKPHPSQNKPARRGSATVKLGAPLTTPKPKQLE